MSYRFLHHSLLVLLLGLDIAAINASAVGAFWLRCRTTLFEAPAVEVIRPAPNRTDDTGVLRVDLGGVFQVDRVEIDFEGGAPGSAVLELGSDDAGHVGGTVSGTSAVFRIENELRSFRIPTGGLGVAGVKVVGYAADASWYDMRPATLVPREPYEYLLVLWNVLALVGLLGNGAYRITRSLEVVDDFLLVMKAVAVAAVSVIVILFLYRGYQEATYLGFEYSRLVVILGVVLSVVLLTINRLAVDAAHRFFLKRGLGSRRVLVVGAGPSGRQIVERLRSHYWLAYEPVGFVDDDTRLHGQIISKIPVMGGTSQLRDVAAAAGTAEVIVALPNSAHKAVRDIVGRCHAESLKFRILPDLFEVISSDVHLRSLDGIPILDLDDHYLERWDRIIKRGFDVASSLLGIVTISPLLVALALLIKASSRGPILFVQTRVGEHGKSFRMYKFRTMFVVSDAEDRAQREADFRMALEKGEGGKVVNERRVTWIGRFMRRFSLDELPQVFNVLKGDMSFVGPRPPIPYEVESYNTWHMERLKGKPGITGLWQVSGRADLPFEEMVKLDIYYLKHWSLWEDFKILLKTLPVVLTGRGAR